MHHHLAANMHHIGKPAIGLAILGFTLWSERLDEIGKPAWIGLTLLSFFLWWPLGLVVLGFLIGSGRMACWTEGAGPRWQRRMDRMQRRMERMQQAAERWGLGGGGSRSHYREATGNRAFDEYRTETLRRLEEEQREFMEFLDRLRHAKDKAEFDEFMAERRRRSEGPLPQQVQTI
ncbi:MAG: DUF2852 domain-containing protein [Stellaceae bacterium]